jgi:hypothetical protein
MDEAYVEGHPPGPIGTIWPTLTDMTSNRVEPLVLHGGAGGIVSVHHVPTHAGGPVEAVHLAASDLEQTAPRSPLHG